MLYGGNALSLAQHSFVWSGSGSLTGLARIDENTFAQICSRPCPRLFVTSCLEAAHPTVVYEAVWSQSTVCANAAPPLRKVKH